MRIFGVLFLTICFTWAVPAQTDGADITGRMTVDGKTLSVAVVRLVAEGEAGREYATRTDEQGNYRFENVADGVYRIAYADSTGRPVLRDVIVVRGGKDITAEIFGAVRRPGLLGEVSVIAAGVSQLDGEISKTVDVIGQQEIADRNEFAAVDALRTVPGLRIQQLGGFGKTANIKIRGLRNQDTAILVDGVRFRDAAAITGDASPFLGDLMLTGTDRIEVLRGSGSSLYGTNAIGGVLDFRTRRSPAGVHGSLDGETGNLGLNRVRGDLAGGFDRFDFSIGAARTVYAGGIDGEDDAKNTGLAGRYGFRPAGNTTVSGRIYISDAFVRLNSNPDTIGDLPVSNDVIIDAEPLSTEELKRYAAGVSLDQLNAGNANFIPDANDPDSIQKSGFFSGQISLTHIITPSLTLTAAYQGLKTSRENVNDAGGVGFQPFGGAQTSIFDGQIHHLNTRLDWVLSASNLVTVGYEYEWVKFGNDGLTADAAGDFSVRARQRSNTFYVHDLASFLDYKLQFAGGFRAQWFSLEMPRFSAVNAPYSDLSTENPPPAYTFDGSVSYFVEKTGTKLRAHIGNGYRVPSLFERFGSFYSSFSQSFTALGDPLLKPERSIAFDLGLDQRAFRDRARFSATYFYTRLTDTIGYGFGVPDIGATPRPFGGYLNQRGGIARGAEFSARFRPSAATDLFASYTYTNSDQRAPQVAGSRIIRTLGIPEQQFTLLATQRIKNLTLSFDLLASGDYLAPIFDSNNLTFQTYIYRFTGNRRADLTGSYLIPLGKESARLKIYATIGNIFDQRYFENGFRTEGRTVRGGVGVDF